MSFLYAQLVVSLWGLVFPTGVVCELLGEGAAVADSVAVGRSVTEDPAVADALADYDSGRISRARGKLLAIRASADAETAPALDFLVARCDLRLGWGPEAEVGFELATDAMPGLRDAALVERITHARDAEDEALAQHLTAKLSPTHARFPELVFVAAKHALDAGHGRAALAALARLVGQVHWRWNVSRLARWRADAQLMLDGDRVAWRARLAELWLRWPTTAAAREAEPVLLNALHDRGLPSPLSLDDLVEVVVARARGGKGDLGRRLSLAAKARFGAEATGLSTLLLLWRHPVAWTRRTVREATAALDIAVHPAIRDHLRLRRARALRRGGRSAEAMDAYDAIAQTAHGAGRGATADLEGGELASRLGDWARARSFYARFAQRHGATHAQAPHALFALGWAAYRSGEWAEADAALARLAAEHPHAEDRSRRSYAERAAYWRARVAQRRGDVPEAKRRWRTVMSLYPHSYYATLARHRLVAASEAVATLGTGGDARDFDAPAPWQVRPVEPSAASAVALLRVGLPKAARADLRRLHDLGRLGPRGVELVSAIYRQKPDWWRSHWIVQHADPLDASPDGPERPRWLAAYPTPYAGVVLREAKEHGIDPLLIWSVMRQESAFRVRARSHASALGLMQVLYPTAKLVARKLHEPEPRLEYVLTRRGNVHYGAAYLRHLLNYFDGNLMYAIAGYNAGPGAVNDWRERFGDLESDEFVEQIPYDEARGYTRKVLRSYAAYRAVYGPEGETDPWAAPRMKPDPRRPARIARR